MLITAGIEYKSMGVISAKTTLSFSVLAVAMLFSWTVCTQSLHAGSPRKEDANIDTFVVGPIAVLLPKGTFLLIRKGSDVGAVRFTNIEQGSNVGEGRAAFESFFFGQWSEKSGVQSAKRQTGEIDLKPLQGLGRLSFQLGQDKILVGKWAFGCDYPGRINM